MTTEQLLLKKWRSLSPDKKQEVFDFIEFLQSRQASISESSSESQSKVDLGEHLQQIRERILASGVSLLTDEEIDQEVAERRGGYQESI
jgi:SpoU rRNA methylase family enzyme